MTSGSVRVTVHSSSVAVNSKHNDRQFDAGKTNHIHPERSGDNVYWQYNMDPDTGIRPGTFEDAEEEFYEAHFTDGLQKKNNRYIKNGHKERCRTVEQYRKAKNSRPEETIFMIGDKEATVSPEILWQIVSEHLAWKQTMFPQNVTIDVALHVDEDGGPHVHERSVWIGHDDYGDEIVSQKRALNEMGIERPDPNEPENKNNNSKMTYTQLTRQHFIEVCKEHGFDVEEVPKEASKVGLSLIQYQFNQEAEKLEQITLENKRLETENKNLSEEIEIGHEELERTLTQKTEAAKVRHRLGDKDTVHYHKDSINQVQDIAARARKDREEAERKHSWAIYEKREAEKLKSDYEEGTKLKEEYERKISSLDETIEARAHELADEKFARFISYNSQPNRAEAMEEFLDGLHRQGNSDQSLLDEFEEAYAKELEELEQEWDGFDVGEDE